MHHPHVLVVYASTHGHTVKIATRLTEVLRESGVSVRLRRIGEPGTRRVEPADYDAVLVGGSVHAGHHQHELVDWIAEHHAELSDRPSAFFSVSLTAADDDPEARAGTQAAIDDVLTETGWTPSTTRAFAGALQFKEYNLPTRVLMRLIARRIAHRTGTHVDVHEDTDYTDWAAVERFAQTFAATLSTTGVPS